MDVNRELKRLGYTISNQHKPNQTDADALNKLIDYVSEERSRLLNNYNLFARLFVIVFKNESIRNGGNYQKSLDNIRMHLKIDLESQIESFNREVNQLRLENQIEDGKSIDEIKFISWTKEDTQNRIEELITNLIEDYGK